MRIGRITSLSADRGFGFVAENGKDVELYFHQSALVAGALYQMKVGQAVAFEVVVDPRDGMREIAVNVQLIDVRP